MKIRELIDMLDEFGNEVDVVPVMEDGDRDVEFTIGEVMYSQGRVEIRLER